MTRHNSSYNSRSLIARALSAEAEVGVEEVDMWPELERRLNTAPVYGVSEQSGDVEVHGTAPSTRSRSARVTKARPLLSMGLAAILLIVGIVSSARLWHTQDGPTAAAFSLAVPPGKVLHIVAHETTQEGAVAGELGTPAQKARSPEYSTWNLWYKVAEQHLLGYTLITADPGSARGPYTKTVRIQSDAVYLFQQDGSDLTGDVTWYPASPSVPASFVPDPELLDRALKAPNAGLVGNTILNGMPAIEVVSSDHYHQAANNSDQLLEHYTWVHATEQRTLQEQYITRNMSATGKPVESPGALGIVTDTVTVVSYEMLDASTFPANFFTFVPPPGAKLVRMDNPWAQPTNTSEPMLTATPPILQVPRVDTTPPAQRVP